MHNILECENLSKYFGPVKALDSVTLSIPKGRIVGLLGPNGSGKTTLMSREAQLYLLDEPIGGVDPAARDYILETIIKNYSENATIIISTHLISDIEKILDDIVFLKDGQVILTKTVDEVRDEYGKSIDALFREVFRC